MRQGHGLNPDTEGPEYCHRVMQLESLCLGSLQWRSICAACILHPDVLVQKDHYELGEAIPELYLEVLNVEQFRIKISTQLVEPRARGEAPVGTSITR